MKAGFTGLFVCLFAAVGFASVGQAPDVAANAKRADKVVVAVVEDVQSRFAENEFGDRLIVSEVWLRVEETLKGTSQALMTVDVEGGTVGDLTLKVSDLPALKKGDRGVFLLDSTAAGKNKPHARGAGILKLDASDRVTGSSLRLADVRASVRASQK
jgi:hypothetical protein